MIYKTKSKPTITIFPKHPFSVPSNSLNTKLIKQKKLLKLGHKGPYFDKFSVSEQFPRYCGIYQLKVSFGAL